MDAFERNALGLGLTLGAMLLSGLARRRTGWGLPFVALALALSLAWDLAPGAVWAQAAPWTPALRLGAWTLLSAAWVRCGGPWLPALPAGVGAAALGLLAGPLAGPALVRQRGGSARAAALSVLASGLSPMAQPALLALDLPAATLAPLVILGAAFTWPSGGLRAGGDRRATWLSLALAPALALAAAMPAAWAPAAALGAGAALAFALPGGASSPGAGELIWLASLAAALGLAKAGGVLHQAAIGCEHLLAFSPWMAPALCLGAALVSASAGAAGASLVVAALLGALVVPGTPGLPALLAAGVVLGRVGPAAVGAGWREGARAWALAAALPLALHVAGWLT